jgi:hypothetical protein
MTQKYEMRDIAKKRMIPIGETDAQGAFMHLPPQIVFSDREVSVD